MPHSWWLLLVLFFSITASQENAKEETEIDAGREGKYFPPPFGQFKTDLAPCSPIEDAAQLPAYVAGDSEGVTVSHVFIEEQQPSMSEISELLQLLREFKKHNFREPSHFHSLYSQPSALDTKDPSSEEFPLDGSSVTENYDAPYVPFSLLPLASDFHHVHQLPMYKEDEITGKHIPKFPKGKAGFPEIKFGGYVPFYTCILPPLCNPHQCQLHHQSLSSVAEVPMQPIHEPKFENESPSSTTIFANKFSSENSFTPSATEDTSSNSFMWQPAESFDEKSNYYEPNYSRWSSPVITVEDASSYQSYSLPPLTKTDENMNIYNPTNYRTYHSTPVSTADEFPTEYYSSPPRTYYSTSLSAADEFPTEYYSSPPRTYYSTSVGATDEFPAEYYSSPPRTYYSTSVGATDEFPTEYYSSPPRTYYSPTSTSVDEIPTVYYPSSYRAHKEPLRKTHEEISRAHHPVNHRRVHASPAEDISISRYLAALDYLPTATTAHYPNNYKPYYDEVAYFAPPAEETVMEKPTAYYSGVPSGEPRSYRGRHARYYNSVM